MYYIEYLRKGQTWHNDTENAFTEIQKTHSGNHAVIMDVYDGHINSKL